jgi:putative transposase
MKRSRFSEQQTAFIPKQAMDGITVEEVCRKSGLSIQTYSRWLSKYGDLMPSETKRLKVLEEENVRLIPLDETDVNDGVPASFSPVWLPPGNSGRLNARRHQI